MSHQPEVRTFRRISTARKADNLPIGTEFDENVSLDEDLYQSWLIQLQTWAADGRMFAASVDALRLKRIDERQQTLAAEA